MDKSHVENTLKSHEKSLVFDTSGSPKTQRPEVIYWEQTEERLMF